MSKKPPPNQSSRKPGNNQPHRPSTKEEHFTPVLDPKYLNVSAGGHFYERAKSRRLRTNAVFKSTAGGQAVVAEAVPLGSKRKGSGMRAMSVLREGVERIRGDNRKKPRDENGKDDGRTGSVTAQAQKSTGAEDEGAKKK
jgi:hypothetical protein